MGLGNSGEYRKHVNPDGVVSEAVEEQGSLPIELDTNFFAITEALHATEPSLNEVELAQTVNSFKEIVYSRNKDADSYKKTIEAAEKLIDFFDEAALVGYVKSKNFHRTLLERILDKWSADDVRESTAGFKKLVRVMVETGLLKYKTDVQITDELTAAESGGIVKELENFITTHSIQQVVDSVTVGEISLSVVNKLNEEIKKREIPVSQALVDKMTEIVAALRDLQKEADDLVAHRIRKSNIIGTLEANSKDETLIMLANGTLNPNSIIELSERIASGSFPSYPNLNFALNEIRSELTFYKDLYRAEVIVQKSKDFAEVITHVGPKKMQIDIQTLKILLDLYKAEIRPNIGHCKEKIESVLKVLNKE